MRKGERHGGMGDSGSDTASTPTVGVARFEPTHLSLRPGSSTIASTEELLPNHFISRFDDVACSKHI